jgi:L-serine dehydratase
MGEGKMDSETGDLGNFSIPELDYSDPPEGSDRRTFMMRSAMATAIAAVGGVANPLWAQAQAGAPIGSAPVDPNLEVVKKSKGPVMTLIDEFYKVGPGPSSSHTIGPMRITYDSPTTSISA